MTPFLSLRLSAVELKKEGEGKQDDLPRGLQGAATSLGGGLRRGLGGGDTGGASRAGCGHRL